MAQAVSLWGNGYREERPGVERKRVLLDREGGTMGHD